jgi:hypothetical protein
LGGHWHGENGPASSGGKPFPYFLPAFHRAPATPLRVGEHKRNKEQSMDVVYVLLGLAFFLISYVLVQLIGRLQ